MDAETRNTLLRVMPAMAFQSVLNHHRAGAFEYFFDVHPYWAGQKPSSMFGYNHHGNLSCQERSP